MIHAWIAMIKEKIMTPATDHPVVVIVAFAAMAALLLGALVPLFLD